MTLKDYNFIITAILLSVVSYAQQTITGNVVAKSTQSPIQDVLIYDKQSGLLTQTNANGSFTFTTEKETLTLAFFTYEFEIEERTINTNTTTN